MKLFGSGRAAGAAGEVIQGQFENGRDFLVSLPVNLWSLAEVELEEGISGLSCAEAFRKKSEQAAKLLLHDLGESHLGGRIRIRSEIPTGIGMASSTADITATCLAIGAALEIQISAEQICQIASRIEPSDGIMFPGLVCFDHIRCEPILHLGEAPPIDVLVLNPGGTVDTIAFNQLEKSYTGDEKSKLEAALRRLEKAVQQQSPTEIGQVGTESAIINQRLLFKPELDQLLQMGKEFGCLGLSVGHSGTVINILFEAGNDGLQALEKAIQESELEFRRVWRTQTLQQAQMEQVLGR